ncbi:TetR/AcrR family transcriptional regulator [Tessaracoccus sp. HDW20]|uniref:TetR/AcrR family transcriptional regulator n=1 Tax=Tessaracoccus coleopterorum TaxID=2714950 RepID=UPI0018D3F677|nr:TetR/AcrR family transcriptional regulator C-terminal domain-containing protein [Tessaracoccus coleopterorum]NHB86102.1 TetR/AcrR family transcriptional regulator [Tessaracoccus coleopterorum]
MAAPLIDLLWRDHPAAAPPRRRGPRARLATGDVVAHAVRVADAEGLSAVTVRTLATALGVTPMSVYTYVNDRDELLVLMADLVHGAAPRTGFGRSGWRTRVRRVADDNLAMLRAHPWLLEVDDPRIALGPGTIERYEHELRAFDRTGLGDLERDAALSFVLDFVRASAARLIPPAVDFTATWADSVAPLARYLGTGFSLAQRVGRAAGEVTGSPYDASYAWRFGLDRVLAGLADLIGSEP